MGKLTNAGEDFARFVDTGSRTTTGVTPWVLIQDPTNLSIWGTFTATVALERSFDGGVTAVPCTVGGQAVSFTRAVSEVIDSEPENGVLYRLNVSAISAGTVNWRFSR